MDADSSYGGSDTAQDSHSAHEHSTSLDHSHTTDASMDGSHRNNDKITLAVHHMPNPEVELEHAPPTSKPFYHSNEVTVPVNMDEADYTQSRDNKNAPHYLSTARIDISESLEHHSNLEEMSRNYKSTNRLNETPESQRKYVGGVENPAFVGDSNIKSTFNSEKPYNGELNSLGVCSLNKTEDPMTEAVNLELINLKPGENATESYDVAGNGLTTIPLKKDNERDIGGPFDEYFVPVNEHRKYMRGEKLYVTKDKRGEKGKSKCLCWGICLAIVVAALIVGILAAVGIIGNKGPMPQEVSARHFDGSQKDVLKGGLSIPGIESGQQTPYTPQPPISTIPQFPPSTDTSMIEVPRALESQLRISNLQFNSDLSDKNSSEFQALAGVLEEDIKNNLLSQNSFEGVPAEIEVKVMEFMPGSVVVKYRIVWKPKNGITMTHDHIDEHMVDKSLLDMLNTNNNLLGPYYIEESSVKTGKILDLCQIQNNGCEHICLFDYEIADFMCTCTHGKILSSNKKTCVERSEMHGLDLSNDGNYHHSTTTEPAVSSDHEHHNYENTINVLPEPEPASNINEKMYPETEHILKSNETKETENDTKYEQPTETNFHSEKGADTEPVPNSEPEPTAEPDNKAIHEPSSETEPNSNPEPSSDSNNHEITVQPEPHSGFESASPSEPTVSIEHEPTSEPEPKSESQPETTPEPEPNSEPEPSIESINQTKHGLILESDPKSEPGTNSEYHSYTMHYIHIEPESTSEPEPNSEPEPTVELVNQTEHDHILESEPKSERELKSKSQQYADLNVHIEPETTPEPEPEPNSEPEPSVEVFNQTKHHHTLESEPKSEPEPSTATYTELKYEPTLKSEPELTTEPQQFGYKMPIEIELNPESESTTEPTTTLKHEPTVEPTTSLKPEQTSTQQPEAEPGITIVPLNNMDSQPQNFSTAEVLTKDEPETSTFPELITTTEAEYMFGVVSNVDVPLKKEFELVNETENQVTTQSNNISEGEYKSEIHQVETTTSLEHKVEAKQESDMNPEMQSVLVTEMSTEPHNQDRLTTTITNEVILETTLPDDEVTVNTSSEPLQSNNAEHTTEVAVAPHSTAPTNANITETATVNPSTTEFIPVFNKSEQVNREDYYYPGSIIVPFQNIAQERDEFTDHMKNSTMDKIDHENLMIESDSVTKMSLEDSGNSTLTFVANSDNTNVEITTESNIPSVAQNITSTPINQIDSNLTSKSHITTDEEIITSTTSASSLQVAHSNEDSIQNSTMSSITSTEASTHSTSDDENLISHIPSVTNHHTTEGARVFNQLNITEIHREPKIQDIQMDDSVYLSSMINNSEPMSDEYMSPFLPELYNDTFINSLHSDEHFLEHNIISKDNESHENSTSSNPPRLDFDQMNHTNPSDDGTFNSFKVNGAATADNVTVITELPTADTTSRIAENSTHQSKMGEVIEHSLGGPDHESVVEIPNSHNNNLSADTLTFETTDKIDMTTTAKSDVTTTVPQSETTLPLEIINNVHSNTYFDQLSKDIFEIRSSSTSETPSVQSKDLTEAISSTEDLVAMETTTNTHKVPENNTTTENVPKLFETSTEIKTEPVSTTDEISTLVMETTISDRKMDNISEKSTESLKQINETNSNQSASKSENKQLAQTTVPNLEGTTINGEIIETATSSITLKTSEEDNNIIESSDGNGAHSKKLYEVKETTHDITTTEKLFLVPKSTTEAYLENDLSVIPLDVEKHKAPYYQFSSSETSNDILDENDKNQKIIENRSISNSLSNVNSTNSLDSHKDVLTYLAENNAFSSTVPTETEEVNQIKPVTENFELPKFVRCSVGQFQCINGTAVKDGSYCIEIGSRCDSHFDCSDKSDEAKCTQEGCSTNFQCKMGQCLKRQFVCDGITNCNDGSDEDNCDAWTCNFDEFSCNSGGKCIPLSWKCDGKSHCPDGSDEMNCPTTCSENSFYCTEQGRCIPNSWRCDGEVDCKNSEDEKLCECDIDQFKCESGGGCIPKENRCDGIDHCADRSDEWNCLKLDTLPNKILSDKKVLQVLSGNNTWSPICMEWTNWTEFKYADSACQFLGYPGSSALESVPKPEGYQGSVYKLNHVSSKSSLLPLHESNHEQCDQFVTVTCQDYVCGNPSSIEGQSGRIIGGDKATPTQWPSLSLLYNKKSNMYCTATLITPLWAIASYSCVEDSSHLINDRDWSLYAGGTPKADNASSQVRAVEEIVTHPQIKFSQFEYTNDAVLIKMVSPVTINVNTSAICLAEKTVQPRQLCIIAGWGVSHPGEPVKHQYLHYLPVPMIDMQECNSTKHYNGKVASDKICAGYTDTEKTACYNDEGAPLMCFSETTYSWELQGLLSHHDNCGSNRHPAIYTSIEPRLKVWIQNTIGNQGFTKKANEL